MFAGGLEGGRATAAPARHTVATDADEYELKAAFLYNFARYAKWPDGAFATKTSPLVIAVVGKDPFGKRLEETLGDKRVGRHPIVIRRYATAKDIKDAHLLFLGEMSEKERKASVERVKTRPVLVVADEGGVTATGAAIGFYLDRKRIRFEVSVKALERTRLRLSSKLLKLARIVRPEKSPEGSSEKDSKKAPGEGDDG